MNPVRVQRCLSNTVRNARRNKKWHVKDLTIPRGLKIRRNYIEPCFSRGKVESVCFKQV